MKATIFLPAIALLFLFSGCKKAAENEPTIPIPNGDFELWDSMPVLYNWVTNSCPACLPPYDTYIVKKVTDVASGQFAAQFVYNGVYSSVAANKFSIAQHPAALTGFIKSTIAGGDTAIIHIDLFLGNTLVDSGNFYETASTANYKKITIPVSQNSVKADSAAIKITGGKKQPTVLYVDNLVLLKNN